ALPWRPLGESPSGVRLSRLTEEFELHHSRSACSSVFAANNASRLTYTGPWGEFSLSRTLASGSCDSPLSGKSVEPALVELTRRAATNKALVPDVEPHFHSANNRACLRIFFFPTPRG